MDIDSLNIQNPKQRSFYSFLKQDIQYVHVTMHVMSSLCKMKKSNFKNKKNCDHGNLISNSGVPLI